MCYTVREVKPVNRIKELRTEKGILQTELAKHLKIGQATISNWETGRSEPDQDALKELSKFFGASIDYILGNTDTKKPLASEDMSGLTDKQIKILQMMEKMTPEQQDEILRQAEYQLWMQQHHKAGR